MIISEQLACFHGAFHVLMKNRSAARPSPTRKTRGCVQGSNQVSVACRPCPFCQVGQQCDAHCLATPHDNTAHNLSGGRGTKRERRAPESKDPKHLPAKQPPGYQALARRPPWSACGAPAPKPPRPDRPNSDRITGLLSPNGSRPRDTPPSRGILRGAGKTNRHGGKGKPLRPSTKVGACHGTAHNPHRG